MTAPATTTCVVCGAALPPGSRPHRKTCSARCRKRLSDDDGYLVTEEDRAAIRRVLERDGCGHPGAVLTPDQVRAHLLTTAERT